MMRLVIVVENMKSYFSFVKTYNLIFLFEQSTRKCKWEFYDGQAKFLDEIKVKQVIAWKFGYGPQFVDLFVKQHIKKMREFARQRSFCNSVSVRFDKLGWRHRGWQRRRGQGRRQERKQEYRCRS
jgi:hypothetical protein